MAQPQITVPRQTAPQQQTTPPPWWKPAWSVPAGMRAARATVIVPALLALTYKVIADPQMALFATFGGFATLVIAGFAGNWRVKLTAHAGLAVAGSLVLVIGTLVSSTTWLAVLVTVPVVFAILFAGVGGPNVASGATAAMFAYVLPVASAGDASMIASRLEGWWLASAAGTLAVLLTSPRPAGDRLRSAAAELAAELAARLTAAADGAPTEPAVMRAAKERLRTAFTAAPFRPTGLATADQALASMVQLLEWGTTQVGDAFDGHVDMTGACQADQRLLRASAAGFTAAAALLSGQRADPEFGPLEAARAASAAQLRGLTGEAGDADTRVATAQAVHAQAIAVVARSVIADALVVSGRATPEAVAELRREWYGGDEAGQVGQNGGGRLRLSGDTSRMAGLSRAAFLVSRHASVRSVWFLNSLRGAVALAAAVAIADLSGVQHGFWVVLGTLSVLRTSAAATGATAWRALAGTAVGFAVGALLLLAIGTGQPALWAALPLAVLVASYAPGTTPFLVGQAAFTVTIVVLFNLLVPVGWQVGLLRVEDVAIGCAVSFAVGVLLWPRGASAVVADDLADAFRCGARYLTQAVDWALSEVMVPPAAAVAAVSAGIRLEDAVRGLLTEQGSKRVSKEDLWTLVNASTRLRLTAHTLAGLRRAEPVTVPAPADGAAPVDGAVLADGAAPVVSGNLAGAGGLTAARAVAVALACAPLAGSGAYAGTPACTALRGVAAGLAGFYDQVADAVSRPGRADDPAAVAPIPAPESPGPAVPRRGAAPDGDGAGVLAGVASHPHLLWVQEHLHHLGHSARSVSEPAARLAEIRRRPWWR